MTGPTGSGKTTSLYAALNELNTPDKKIITAEDPVEYYLPGINQVEVKHQIGLDFARIMEILDPAGAAGMGGRLAALLEKGIDLDEIIRLSTNPDARGTLLEVEDHKTHERVVIALE